MNVTEFIAKKRDGGTHQPNEISTFIKALVNNEVRDYQTSAWLMAAFLNGLNDDEATEFTLAMSRSGKVLDLSSLPQPTIDKHSTGGVGDTVTPILLPILSACGFTVAKMSGRGLGFTGGTIDKLASIPGFKTSLTPDTLIKQAEQIGISLAEQTDDLAPADKILYSLRDATETVGSIPLIAASVMSKKLALGASIIILDVKVGSGAFMKDLNSARKLAQTMVTIGKNAGKKTRAILSSMEQPLSCAIGNALEIKTAIQELKGGCTTRLGMLTKHLAQKACEIANKSVNLTEVIRSGNALEKMRSWIKAQGGNDKVIEDFSLFPRAKVVAPVHSEKSGYVNKINTLKLGEIARALGAGRYSKEDTIDLSVGIEMQCSLGDKIDVSQKIALIHAKDEDSAEIAKRNLIESIYISEDKPEVPPLILEEIE